VVGTVDGIVSGTDHHGLAVKAGVTYIAVVGIEAMIVDGTESGTLVQSTTTIDGDCGTVTTWVDGSDATHVAGTNTGEAKVDGTVTVAGV
jgi:hypothetical protein